MSGKLREALSDACYAMFNFLKTQNGGYEEMANALDKAKATLAEPLRNCDVGTAEEQIGRWQKFCKTQTNCEECPYYKCGDMCFARWAQMPYKKEGEVK